MTRTLAEEIVHWDRETRAILASIKIVVRYLGSDKEYEWLLAVLHERESYLEGVLPAFRDPAWHANITWRSVPQFVLERSTAEKITPLLQLVVEPVPDFIPWSREELEPAHFKAVMRYAGVFLGDMAVDICDPIWGSFPDLAPEGYPLGDRRLLSEHASRRDSPLNDTNEVMATLADQIIRWDTETRSILLTIKRIAEYFGTDEEYESLLTALRPPEVYFQGVLTAFRDPAWREETAGFAAHTLACERSIAEKITPLLQILVEPMPEFISRAREELEPAHASAVIWHFGAFSSKIEENICKPIWRNFRDLAPEGYPR